MQNRRHPRRAARHRRPVQPQGPQARITPAQAAQAALAAQQNQHQGAAYREVLLQASTPPGQDTLTVSDVGFNALHTVITGYPPGGWTIGATAPPKHHFRLLQFIPHGANPVAIRNVANQVHAFFTARVPIHGDPRRGREELGVRFLAEIIDLSLMELNNRGGQAPIQGAQHLITLQGRQMAPLAVSPDMRIHLPQPPVEGRSDMVILANQGRSQFAPLCVVEVKRGSESVTNALTEGIITATALGLRHNLPFVNGIATNLTRWIFFRVEAQGVFVSSHCDLSFDDGVPLLNPPRTRTPLREVISWILSSLEG